MPARNRRLPRHLSWPLTATDVRVALGERLSGGDRISFGHRPSDDGTLLQVEWVPPIPANYGGGIHPAWWRTVRVDVIPLPAVGRAAAREALKQHALPELAAWIDSARRAPEGWTLARHYRSWRLADSETVHGTVHRDDRQPYPITARS